MHTIFSHLAWQIQRAFTGTLQWNAFVGMQETRMRPNHSVDVVGSGQFSPPLHAMASARISSVHAGLSAAWQAEGMTLSVGAAHTWHHLHSQRQLAMGGLTDALSSRYRARTMQVFGELAADGAKLTPYARLAWVQTHTHGHTEAGGPAALQLDRTRQRVLFSTIGLRAQHTVATAIGQARVYGELAWRHAAGAFRPISVQQFAGAPALGEFTSHGLPISRHALQLQAGVSAQLSDSATLRLAYAGQYGRGSQEHGVQLGVTVAF